MAAENQRTVGDAPDLFVGIGEAAEVLDVPHVRLHEAIRDGRLSTYAGRRDGRLVRLLRLGDLIALDPALANRPLPELPHAAPTDAPTNAPTNAPAAQGPRGEPRERAEPEVPASPAPTGPRGARRGRGDARSQEESLRYLWGELERVRSHVRDSREQQDTLVRQLLENGEEARRLFDKLSLDEESRRAAQAELTRERADVDRALDELRRVRRLTLASVTVVVLLAVGAIGYVARAALEPTQAAEGAEVAAAQPPPKAAPSETPQSGTLESGTLEFDSPSDDGREEVRADLVSHRADSERENLAPAAPPVGTAGREGSADGSSPPPTTDATPDETTLETNPVAVPESPAAPEESAPESEVPVEVEVPVQEVVASDSTDREIPGRPPAGVQPGDRACELFAVTQPGMPLREVLGPCWGRWNPALSATVGSSRSGGEAYCRQHAFFERALGASLARAEQEADLARDAGLVPPLLRMRVETAASAALAGYVANWLESGFEAGSVDGHRVRAVARGANHWRVDSWVRYVDFAGNDRRRTFRLEVVLGDGPDPDRERAFVWTDTDPADGDR